jgi:ubiquinone biosynthesis protein
MANDLRKTAMVLARFGPRLPGMIENILLQQTQTPPPAKPSKWLRRFILLSIGAGTGAVAMLTWLVVG